MGAVAAEGMRGPGRGRLLLALSALLGVSLSSDTIGYAFAFVLDSSVPRTVLLVFRATMWTVSELLLDAAIVHECCFSQSI